MSEWLEKKKTLHQRDENGNLLGVEVMLETLPDKPKVLLRPMTRGKIQRLYQNSKTQETTPEQDAELITEHCLKPEYTLQEAKDLKVNIAGAIVTALISISTNVSQQDILNKTNAQVVGYQEDLLKKKA